MPPLRPLAYRRRQGRIPTIWRRNWPKIFGNCAANATGHTKSKGSATAAGPAIAQQQKSPGSRSRCHARRCSEHCKLPIGGSNAVWAASTSEAALLPVPATHPQPLVQMCRRRRYHADWLLVLRDRDHDLARMQMQRRLAEARTAAIDVVAEDWPARR